MTSQYKIESLDDGFTIFFKNEEVAGRPYGREGEARVDDVHFWLRVVNHLNQRIEALEADVKRLKRKNVDTIEEWADLQTDDDQ